jgi:hypothetical protein
MAKRKEPDYGKAFQKASAALTALKIEHGHLHGSFMGSGDRQWAIERLKRWCDLAEQHLSTEMVDQVAWRIEMYLAGEALDKGDMEEALKWHSQWEAELVEDKRAHRQVQ